MGRVRPAGGKCRDRQQAASARMDAAEYRGHEEDPSALCLQLRLGSRNLHLRTRILPLEPVVLPQDDGARPGVPEEGTGQLVVEGCCWRHEDTPVEQRALEQWFLKITSYADQLLDDMKELEGGWPERVLTMQRNWIGRSEGAEGDFPLGDSATPIRVFTTRVDTIYGATCVILAPEHPLNETLLDEAGKAQAKAMVDARANRGPGDVEKEGFFSGHYAINPYSGEKAPIWVGNFVLMGYGTGAIMAVPAHDERDFEFCRKYGIAVRPVIRPVTGELAVEPGLQVAFTDDGVVEDSGPWSGLPSG